MTNMIFLIFVGLVFLAKSSDAICCDSIKSLVDKKVEAMKTLCSAGTTLSAECCSDIANEVKKHVAAYKALCLNSASGSCGQALGMASGEIPDNAITASSVYTSSYQPFYARLNKTGSACSWTPSVKTNSWIQVDLGKLTSVTGVSTQGSCYGNGERLESYTVSYSADGKEWTKYKESGKVKVFQGNNDWNTIVTHSFKSPFKARYMRLWPVSWNSYPTMRLEYYGCRQ